MYYSIYYEYFYADSQVISNGRGGEYADREYADREYAESSTSYSVTLYNIKCVQWKSSIIFSIENITRSSTIKSCTCGWNDRITVLFQETVQSNKS